MKFRLFNRNKIQEKKSFVKVKKNANTIERIYKKDNALCEYSQQK